MTSQRERLEQSFHEYNSRYPCTARLDYYEQMAKAAQERRSYPAMNQWPVNRKIPALAQTLHSMLISIKAARASMAEGNFDRFAQWFERVMIDAHQAKIDAFDYAKRSKAGKNTAEKNKNGKTINHSKVLEEYRRYIQHHDKRYFAAYAAEKFNCSARQIRNIIK